MIDFAAGNPLYYDPNFPHPRRDYTNDDGWSTIGGLLQSGRDMDDLAMNYRKTMLRDHTKEITDNSESILKGEKLELIWI
jgi:hypothetical protein